MKNQRFSPALFTPTKWSTAEDKAKFANHFVRFVESGFKASLFPKWFYIRLSNTFGHIAHYDQGGFYGTWFESLDDQLNFLRHTLQGGGYGDPAWTYSDVEKALQDWLKESGLLEKYRQMRDEAHLDGKRRLYEQLKKEFEPEANS